MLNTSNENNERQELLNKTLFSYIGYHHVQNLSQELDSKKGEINNITISESLNKWFYKFNSDSKRKDKHGNLFKNTIRKVAIIFLVLAISMTLLTVSVDAFRVRVFNLIIEANEKYLSIKAEEDVRDKNDSYDDIKGYYAPSYIPEGFVLDSVENFGGSTTMIFINIKNQRILFDQSPIGTSFQIDSEDAIIDEITINDVQGIAIIKEESNKIFWSNKDFNFYISSAIEPSEMIKVAESLKINK